MAWLEKRSDTYRIVFRYDGRKFRHELKTESEREANALLGRLEENLILLERGKLQPPTDGNLGLFLLSDGKITEKPKVEVSVPLKAFFERYRKEFPKGAKEANTRYTEEVHMRNLERLIGPRFGVRSITNDTLQTYVNDRSQETGRSGEPLSHTTIQKEIGTLASIWNKWGGKAGLVAGSAPTKGLIYSKTKTQEPFQTWQQIEQRIKRGKLSAVDQQKLWDCLFLSVEQIETLLTDARKAARFDFVHPLTGKSAMLYAKKCELAEYYKEAELRKSISALRKRVERAGIFHRITGYAAKDRAVLEAKEERFKNIRERTGEYLDAITTQRDLAKADLAARHARENEYARRYLAKRKPALYREEMTNERGPQHTCPREKQPGESNELGRER